MQSWKILKIILEYIFTMNYCSYNNQQPIKEIKMLTKKDKAIIKAINKSRGCPIDGDSPLYTNIAKVKAANFPLPKGEVHAVNDSFSTANWKLICTISEFNQTMKEMSEAKWMRKNIEKLTERETKLMTLKEWRLLDQAKKQVIDDLSFIYSHYFGGNQDVAAELFKSAQENGDLAEITIPSEKGHS